MKGGMKLPLTAYWAYTTVVLCTLILDVTRAGECEFSKAWSGRWFQSGIRHLVNINTTSIETKGVCVESSGDRFIMEDKSDIPSCFRCIFITENHPNVLQYKETYCADSQEYKNLDSLCNLISGDASLYLMFRNEPIERPEPCPFKGAPFTFTYNRGSGECGLPVSRIDSCIQDSRLRIHYQACPDIPGTESAVEELVCMAEWKEGSVRYLIGKISRKITTSDEDRYRCFVYERSQHDGRVTYNVAQSGDATCSGVQSPLEGSKTMRLTKVDTDHTKCHYPKWVTDHHKWHSLDYSMSYNFSQKHATLKILHEHDASMETRVVCHGVESNGEHEVRLVAHATKACNSGYICMVFYRRDGHVIELQQSNVTVQVAEEACSPSVFDQNNTPYTTLITTSLKQRKCPYLGRYAVSASASTELAQRRRRREDDGVDSDCNTSHYQHLVVGCGTSDTMEFQAACSSKPDAYSCHASWEMNGTSYLIASPVSRSSVGARRYCFIYTSRTDIDDKQTPVTLTSVTESCHRNLALPETRGMFNFNLTLSGHCEEASMGAVSTTAIILPSIFFILLLIATLANVR